MNESIKNLNNISEIILENSIIEIDKDNKKSQGRAKALKKLATLFTNRIQKIIIPENFTYDSLKIFTKEVHRSLLVTEIDVKNWFPKISPYFMRDRRKFVSALEETKNILVELNNFLEEEYGEVKDINLTLNLLEDLVNSEDNLLRLVDQKNKVEDEVSYNEKQSSQINERISELTAKGVVNQIEVIDSDIKNVNDNIKTSLRHLQKPFKKLESKTLHDKEQYLINEEFEKLNEYLTSPFNALTTERNEYPILKQILSKLETFIFNNKIKLKPDRKRKANQSIENILKKNSLKTLQQKSINLIKLKKTLFTSTELTENKRQITSLKDQLRNQKIRKLKIDTEKKEINKKYEETKKKITNTKKQIEKNILKLTDQRVNVKTNIK